MPLSKPMLVRVQSPDGTKRVEVTKSESTSRLYEKVQEAFDLESFGFALYKGRSQQGEITSSRSKTIQNVGLQHGDMIYMSPVNGTLLRSNLKSGSSFTNDLGAGSSTSSFQSSPMNSTVLVNSNNSSNSSKTALIEDDVDLQLYKQDGNIQRERDPKLCRHNENSRCVHCSPLECYDETYLRDHNIKHLSFHSYVRKMTSGVDKGKFFTLEDISCRIRDGCKDHPPWPKGICSKCQPSAITLNRQVYRHVDNITFENKDIVERFLNYWRTTGHQRIGFLYGTYEVLQSDVPLGIRANVVAIYEPPQESSRDSVHLLCDNRTEIVAQVAHGLGLRCLGWIFTDLLPECAQNGTVKHIRHINSHFLSAEECIMAGHYQNLHPNPCRYASSGNLVFGSKFVTVCVTGDSANQVCMEGYQVSNQCMALVRDNCLVPTKDAPELGYVRESTDKQYVPDVYYKEKDVYGNEVSRSARPLPVEYLLVDVPASMPMTQHYRFNSDATRKAFPIENRLIDGDLQDFNAMIHYLAQFGDDEFPLAINDFHLLLYIAGMEMLPMLNYMGPLLDALRTHNLEVIEDWSKNEHWATLEQLIAASSPPHSRPGSVASGNAQTPLVNGPKWKCSLCTYLNNADTDACEMCTLSKDTTVS